MNLLSEIKKGETVIIEAVTGPNVIKKRVLGIGVAPGVKFKVINKQSDGSLIIANDNRRVAMDKNVSQNIYVYVNDRVEYANK